MPDTLDDLLSASEACLRALRAQADMLRLVQAGRGPQDGAVALCRGRVAASSVQAAACANRVAAHAMESAAASPAAQTDGPIPAPLPSSPLVPPNTRLSTSASQAGQAEEAAPKAKKVLLDKYPAERESFIKRWNSLAADGYVPEYRGGGTTDRQIVKLFNQRWGTAHFRQNVDRILQLIPQAKFLVEEWRPRLEDFLNTNKDRIPKYEVLLNGGYGVDQTARATAALKPPLNPEVTSAAVRMLREVEREKGLTAGTLLQKAVGFYGEPETWTAVVAAKVRDHLIYDRALAEP
ncbi:MAG TPA: hypothetical protein VM098_05580 [Phycisphaerae bacterium]|nr:hypothetical protein [Phycisphaerae bacterium]